MSSILGAKVLAVSGALILAGTSAGLGLHSARNKIKASNDMHDFVQWKVERTLDEIDATPEQSEKINAIVADLMDKGYDLRTAHEETHEAFQAELMKDDPDAEALHAMVDERTAEFNTFAHEVVDAVVEIQQTLTPEQRVQVQEMVKERHAKRGHWH